MSLSRFIEELDEADDGESALLERTIAEARRRSPDLAAALESCALPRRFDATIIGVLRAAPEDVEGNARLEQQLKEYSFVRTLEQGGYAYHDHTRQLLLSRWRRDDRRLELEHLTWRLVGHFEAEHTTATRAVDDAARVSRLIADANPDRFAQLAAILEGKLIAPLAEAVFQLTLVSARTALAWAEQRYHAYEDSGRYSLCLAAVRRTVDIVAASPPAEDTQEVLDWLAFWEGRALSRMSRDADAEATLAALLERGTPQTLLRYWTLGELGTARKCQFKLGEALAAFRDEVALGEESRVDEMNLPLSYVRLGDLHLALGDPAAAAEQFRRAAEAADRAGAAFHRFWAHRAAAEAELERGRRDEALHEALEALDIARTELLDRRAPHLECSDLIGGRFGHDWPPLLDTAFDEGDALVAAFSDPLELHWRRVERAAGHRRTGELRRARRTLTGLGRLEEISDPKQSAQITAKAALELARLEQAQGHLEPAVNQYTRSYDAAAAAGLTREAIEALHRRGEARLALGDLDGAEQDLAAAERAWSEHGHAILTALAQAHRATVSRLRGEREPAERMMDAAGRVLRRAAPGVRIAYLQARAEHDAAFGRWPVAGRAHDEIAKLATRMRRADALARALTALASTATEQGSWAHAREHARDAAAAYDELVANGEYKRPSARRRADRMNADGLRLLVSGDPAQLVRASENFHGALEKAPSAWYDLNAAYAAAALHDWEDAIKHLERALADAAWLCAPAIERRLGAFHVARGEELMAAGDHAAAAEAFADSLAKLTRPAQGDSRARCLAGRGEALMRLGDLDAAEETYRDAYEAGDTTASGRLGDVHAHRGEREEALKSLHTGLPADDPAAVAELAERLIITLGELERPELDAIIADVRAAGGPAAAVELGDRLRIKGHDDASEAVYTAVAGESQVAALHVATARRAADPETARAHYERALEGTDRTAATDAGLALGDMLAEAGDADGAMRAYRRALKADGPHAPRAGYRLALLLREHGQLREAEFHLRSLVSHAGTDIAGPALIALGDVLVESGRQGLAADAYRRAIAMDDVDLVVEASDHLLRLLGETGGDGAEATVFDAVLRAGAKAALGLAERLADAGARDAAAHLLRQAANVSDDLYAADAELLLGRLLEQDGKADEATAAYWRAVTSGDPLVAPEAARRLMEDPGGSTEPLDRVLERGGLAALNLGDALAGQDQADLAERAYRRVAGDPNDLFAAEAALHLGDLLARRGRLSEAEAAYSSVADSGALAAATARERLLELKSRPAAGPEPEGVGR